MTIETDSANTTERISIVPWNGQMLTLEGGDFDCFPHRLHPLDEELSHIIYCLLCHAAGVPSP